MENDSLGWVKIERKIEQNAIWQDNTLFTVWVKLLIVADKRICGVEIPLRKLAARLCVSVNTLRAAIKYLCGIGAVAYNDGRIEIINYERYQSFLQGKVFDFDAPPSPKKTKKTPKNVTTDNEPCDDSEEWARIMAEENGVSAFDTAGAQKSGGACHAVTQPVSANDTKVCHAVTQAYKDYKHKQAVNKHPHSPQRGREDFLFFLGNYPNQNVAAKALEAWEKYKPDMDEVIAGLAWHRMLRQWVRNNGKYVPTAVKFISKKLYADKKPQDEIYFILDVLNPASEKEKLVAWWLAETNTELLALGDNFKINAAFEPEREVMERIVSRCGGDTKLAQNVLTKGWLAGCKSLLAIEQRAVSYIQEINSREYNGR